MNLSTQAINNPKITLKVMALQSEPPIDLEGGDGFCLPWPVYSKSARKKIPFNSSSRYFCYDNVNAMYDLMMEEF